MKKYILLILAVGFVSLAHSQTKTEIYEAITGKSLDNTGLLGKTFAFGDRKRSVMDRGQMVLRISNAATYGYDRWGLNHEFPAGSMAQNGCCTYYWTQSPIVGGLIGGQPSVAVGVRGSVRDSEEEFQPLSGYDAGFVNAEENIGIAFSDIPASWPNLWPIEIDPTGTYTDPNNGETFSGVEAPLHSDIRFPVPHFMQESFPASDPDKRVGYFVVTDNDPIDGNTLENNGVGPLNVRFDIWVVNDASVFANDGLIFIQLMTNVGTDTIKDLYMGISGDPDTPEQGGAEWTDDLAMFIEADDPHIAEKLSDTTDAHLLENLAIVWDPDDQSAGFLSSGVAWIGLKFLEATKIGLDGAETSYDVSTVFSYEYSEDAQSDADAYNTQLKAGIQTPHNTTPHSSDLYNKPYAYGPDITWVIAAGPMDIAPGEQVIFTFADFMGLNEADLLKNARLFQAYYDNDFRTPKPPAPPIVHAVPSDGEVALFWSSEPSESSIDPITEANRFQGYRVYKSTDRGNTWGPIISNNEGNPSGYYLPLAIYDEPDDTSGTYPLGDFFYNLGNNSGLKYSYVDRNVVNGYEYWYTIAAYDGEDSWLGAAVPPLENAPANNPFNEGNNSVAVIPQADPAGFDAGIVQVTHSAGNSDASLVAVNANPFLEDGTMESFLFGGDSIIVSAYSTDLSNAYFVSFTYDSTLELPVWTMIDSSSSDTIVRNEPDLITQYKYLVDGLIPVFENATWNLQIDTVNQNITDIITNTPLAFSVGHSSGIDATWAGFISAIPVTPPEGPAVYAGLDKTYEIRFKEEGSIGTYFMPNLSSSDTVYLPLEVWDVDENRQINYAVYPTSPGKPLFAANSDSTFIFTKNLYIVPANEPYDVELLPHSFFSDAPTLTWMIYFNRTSNEWENGNIIRFSVQYTKPILLGEDMYTIRTTEPNTLVKRGDLNDILVVPNPYIVSSVYETNVEVKEVQFTHLPDDCVIRIYNIAGELIQVLKHEPFSNGYRGPSIEAWNLRSYNEQEIAFGVYYFHVMADGQEKTGKFAVIR
ncbi:MAG: hypothetical protein HQ509_12820 [Candidatus Marinimicrobia bacterium]|nr:hypothetical protein [Candidatus Neomarinimicrobiota bacterium]